MVTSMYMCQNQNLIFNIAAPKWNIEFDGDLFPGCTVFEFSKVAQMRMPHSMKNLKKKKEKQR